MHIKGLTLKDQNWINSKCRGIAKLERHGVREDYLRRELYMLVRGEYASTGGGRTECYHVQVFSLDGNFLRAVSLPNGSKRHHNCDDELQGFRYSSQSAMAVVSPSAAAQE